MSRPFPRIAAALLGTALALGTFAPAAADRSAPTTDPAPVGAAEQRPVAPDDVLRPVPPAPSTRTASDGSSASDDVQPAEGQQAGENGGTTAAPVPSPTTPSALADPVETSAAAADADEPAADTDAAASGVTAAGVAAGPADAPMATAPSTPSVGGCSSVRTQTSGDDTPVGCLVVSIKPVRRGGKPDAHNTGVPAGTRLTVHHGDLTITEANTVIDGLDVRGFITVRAPGVVIRNTVVRGRATSSYRGLVVADVNTASVLVEDTELVPTTPSPYVDGIRGWNITARRVNVHRVIDAVHVYGPNVTIEDSWLHDNAHFANDPNWGGGPSHDDSIQIQVGNNIRIRNNNISGATGAAVQLTQDQGKVSDVHVEKNWIDGGACSINFSEKGRGAFTGVVIKDNVFGRNTKRDSCAVIAPTATRERLSTGANTYTDGATVTVRKG